MRSLSVFLVFLIGLAGPIQAQSIDFGDDSSTWARDGECDDPRFEGPGMTLTPLLQEDIGRDASDCRNAYEAGLLTLRATTADLIIDGINFGTDSSQWSNDGECDDPRFAGAAMTLTPLLANDRLADATDCSEGYLAGQLSLVGVSTKGEIDFGDDSGDWSNDGECDDMRFEGPGMTLTPLLSADIMADATDCQSAFAAGRLSLVGQ